MQAYGKGEFQMSDTAQGFRTLAKSYLASGQFLWLALRSGELQLHFDAPIFANLAHSLELAIKASLLENGKTLLEVEALRHDLKKLYQALPFDRKNDIESHVRSSWRHLLRKARDENEASIQSLGISSPEILREFGILSNSEIGSQLPEWKNDLRWLSDRHKRKGSIFRYYEEHIDQRQNIAAFGLNLDTVPQSTVWTIEALL